MRTGIVEVTFVHWQFTKPWLLCTYNLKRLQRVINASIRQHHLHFANAFPSLLLGICYARSVSANENR